MTQIICARHGVPHIEAGGCLVCAAEAAQRRVASATRTCPHDMVTMDRFGTRVCRSCGAWLECEHRNTLEFPGSGMLCVLRQCADCKAIGFDAGDHIAWMAPRSVDETKG